jgi:hypothetical protein
MAIILYLFLFALYNYTLSPTVFWLDSGEVIASSYLLSISHSPGYVIYNILGKIFSFFPLGNIAVRINLFSAFFGAVSGLCFYFLLNRIEEKKFLLSFFTTLLFSFSYTLWFYSVVAEIYSFVYFFYIFLILLILEFKKNGNIKIFYFFFFLLGISTSLHPYFFVILFPFLILFYKKLNIKNFLVGFFIFFVAISVDIFLPLKSAKGDIFNFGDPEKFGNFLKMITFSTATSHPNLISSFSKLLFQIKVMLRFFYIQSISFLPILFFFGIINISKNIKKFFFWKILFFLPTIPFLLLELEILDIWMIDYSLILSYIVIFVIVFYGIIFLEKILKKEFLLIILIFLTFFQFQRGYYLNNKSRDFSAEFSLNKIIEKFEKNSLIFTDNIGILNLFSYFQEVENKRKDIIVVCLEYLNFDWYLKNLEKKGLKIPKEILKYFRDRIIYNDRRDALNANIIFQENKEIPSYLIFSKEKEQKVFSEIFSQYSQKYVGEIIEFQNEKILRPFISVVKKLERN